MKNNGSVSVFCIGVLLATTGCGGALDSNEADALGHVEQGAVCLDCNDSSDVTGGGTTPTLAAMDMARYQQLAYDNATSGACQEDFSREVGKAELNYALNRNIITQAAYDWGLANFYFPLLTRLDQIIVVCKFTSAAMNLTQYQQLASATHSYCSSVIPRENAMAELNYALSGKLISQAAYDWSLYKSYYPVISRDNQVSAVCSFE